MALQKIQARARSIFVDVGQDGVNNLAVTDLVLGLPMATTGAEVPIMVNIHNYGAEPRHQVGLELLIGKAREVEADPEFRLRGQQGFVDVGPGQTATVTFKCQFRLAGDYIVQARLDHDALNWTIFAPWPFPSRKTCR
jgi:hypothetical protein